MHFIYHIKKSTLLKVSAVQYVLYIHLNVNQINIETLLLIAMYNNIFFINAKYT